MKMLKVSEAARTINMSDDALYAHIRRGNIKAVNYSKRMLRIEENELMRFYHSITKQKAS